MENETRKISFGFVKHKKPNIVFKPEGISKPEIDFVDSFDGAKGKFSYKGNVRSDEPVKKELIIPLIGTRTALDVIRLKLEENKKGQETCDEKSIVNVKNKNNGTVNTTTEEERKQDVTDNGEKLSIDDLAAKEIINDLKANAKEEMLTNTIIIKQCDKIKFSEDKDIPIDYENIPVSDFGLAMLRGMGWTPSTGIGKEQRVVEVITPKLRPKGLGLGADKVVSHHTDKDSDVIITIKSFVKILNGPSKGKYGQVESMDENNGRVIVKLALGGTVSVSEMLLAPVTKKEYDKDSKVLNPTEYERFNLSDKRSEGVIKSEDTDKNYIHNRHRKELYDRRSQNILSKEEMGGVKSRGRSRSPSSPTERRMNHKKKKNQKRDHSADRKHRKSKKRKKKKKYSSDDESENSSREDRIHDRERPKNNSYRSKTKKHKH